MTDRIKEPQTICSTLKQSRTLLKLGLNADTSDMTWIHNVWTPQSVYGENEYMLMSYPKATTSSDTDGTPAWSTEAMLAQLPEYIRQGEDVCRIYIYRDFHHHWTILYECKGSGKGYAANTQLTLRDCAFEMLKWYLINKQTIAHEPKTSE